jgi:hypothetical protein
VSGTLATINATAFDAAGNSSTHEVNVHVSGAPIPTPNPSPTPSSADLTPPQVTITYPASGLRLRRGAQTDITASVSDNVRVTAVKTYADGALICTDTAPPHYCSWTVGSKGRISIQVMAFDAAGNVGTDEIKLFPR